MHSPLSFELPVSWMVYLKNGSKTELQRFPPLVGAKMERGKTHNKENIISKVKITNEIQLSESLSLYQRLVTLP